MNIVSTHPNGIITVEWYDLQANRIRRQILQRDFDTFRSQTPYILLDEQGNIQSVFNTGNTGVSVTPELPTERVSPRFFTIEELEALSRNLNTPSTPPQPVPVPAPTSQTINVPDGTFIGFDGTSSSGTITPPTNPRWIDQAIEAARRREAELMWGRTRVDTGTPIGIDPYLNVESSPIVEEPEPAAVPVNNTTNYYSGFTGTISSSSGGRFTVNGINSGRNDENSSTTPRKKYNGMSVDDYMSSLGY